MLFPDQPVVVRGGGDLASGAIASLRTAGFPVIVLELATPLAIRRTVSFASAVAEGSFTVDGMTARRVAGPAEAAEVATEGDIAVMVSDILPDFETPATVIVDARMAKRNIDTHIDDAPLVVALGPGFSAGLHCDAVIETQRGHRLGRVIWKGTAMADTGLPGVVGGVAAERVVRSPTDGNADWLVAIGDSVGAGQPLGSVATTSVTTSIDGVVRGLITPGQAVTTGMKIADVDPRADRRACFEISDKSRLVGAGALAAVLIWLDRGSS